MFMYISQNVSHYSQYNNITLHNRYIHHVYLIQHCQIYLARTTNCIMIMLGFINWNIKSVVVFVLYRVLLYFHSFINGPANDNLGILFLKQLAAYVYMLTECAIFV